MREISEEDLRRLRESNRRLKISLLATLAVVIAGVVLLVAADVSFPLGGGGFIGICIGLLLLIPQRRLLRELGLTNTEARAILEADRERRSGVAALPPAARAERETLRARVFLVAGSVTVLIFLVAAFYFFSKAGETVEEDAPTDYWFAISFFAGFAALCAGPALLWQSQLHRARAESWKAAETGD
ncbi:hypothetical protein Lfu02_60710 [Longispora fulva]|uniref:Multidrug transporter EmrE-like cation transporter n=1 Tax=Longispora fulva TaxID=619741 RepID=A0A8J7GRM6_9ACTN|nr:hypothetical protein [Longispora fulva]MBG6136948.1 multidrug transporter EmrE-like cation transporter [Longispora fulva]GIG61699.1 hypothetical protein Lfu02_60710 [Longispora fulva]